jgi:hypothetical protein
MIRRSQSQPLWKKAVVRVHSLRHEQGPDGEESTQRLTPPHEHSFVREATTWNITFGEEICRVRMMIGFDYIAVLLQNPGEALRALDLRTRAVGLPADASAPLVAECVLGHSRPSGIPSFKIIFSSFLLRMRS